MTPDKATLHGARILLDVSRLISAGARRTPSGIERVELAYVKHFTGAEDVRFVGYFLGRLHLLPFHLPARWSRHGGRRPRRAVPEPSQKWLRSTL
jgi:hypothetical protein